LVGPRVIEVDGADVPRLWSRVRGLWSVVRGPGSGEGYHGLLKATRR